MSGLAHCQSHRGVRSGLNEVRPDHYFTLNLANSEGNDRSELSSVSKLSKMEKRVQVKARMMEDGPRKKHAIVLGCLWTGKSNLNQNA